MAESTKGRFKLVKRGMEWLDHRKGKLGARWLRIDAADKVVGEYIFTTLRPTAPAGSIIEVDFEERDNTVSVFPDSATVAGLYGHPELRLAWRAEEQAVRQAAQEKKKRAKLEKDHKRDPLYDLVEPLRCAYNECRTGAARAQLVSRVTYLMTRDWVLSETPWTGGPPATQWSNIKE
jgi:hypothetical protein